MMIPDSMGVVVRQIRRIFGNQAVTVFLDTAESRLHENKNRQGSTLRSADIMEALTPASARKLADLVVAGAVRAYWDGSEWDFEVRSKKEVG